MTITTKNQLSATALLERHVCIIPYMAYRYRYMLYTSDKYNKNCFFKLKNLNLTTLAIMFTIHSANVFRQNNIKYIRLTRKYVFVNF